MSRWPCQTGEDGYEARCKGDRGNEPEYCADWLMTGVLSELALTAQLPPR